MIKRREGGNQNILAFKRNLILFHRQIETVSTLLVSLVTKSNLSHQFAAGNDRLDIYSRKRMRRVQPVQNHKSEFKKKIRAFRALDLAHKLFFFQGKHRTINLDSVSSDSIRLTR